MSEVWAGCPNLGLATLYVDVSQVFKSIKLPGLEKDHTNEEENHPIRLYLKNLINSLFMKSQAKYDKKI